MFLKNHKSDKSDKSDKAFLMGTGPPPQLKSKKWLPDWIYTMSDDMANQRGDFSAKKMAAGLDLHHVG